MMSHSRINRSFAPKIKCFVRLITFTGHIVLKHFIVCRFMLIKKITVISLLLNYILNSHNANALFFVTLLVKKELCFIKAEETFTFRLLKTQIKSPLTLCTRVLSTLQKSIHVSSVSLTQQKEEKLIRKNNDMRKC